MPGEEGGNPFFRRASSLLPRTPTSHLPPSQDFRLVGRRRAGSPFRLGFEKFLCAVQKRDIPVTSITPSSVCFGVLPPKQTRRRVKGRLAPVSAARALRSAEAAPLPGFQGRSPWGCAGWGSAIEVDEEEAA